MDNLIVGRQPVLEALRSATPLEKICIQFGTHGNAIQHIRQAARQTGVAVKEIDRKKFLELCPDDHAQGVFAIAATQSYLEVDEILDRAAQRNQPAFLLVLDEIEDPQNLGALIRTAECAGAHGVIFPRHHSATLNETVARTSAGASLHLPAAKVTNIANTLDDLRERGVWIIGADQEATRSYDDIDYTGPIAIVVGSEGKGIRRLVKEKCDFLVKIPMFGKVGSLNASVAGALLLYEAVRGRTRKAAQTK